MSVSLGVRATHEEIRLTPERALSVVCLLEIGAIGEAVPLLRLTHPCLKILQLPRPLFSPFPGSPLVPGLLFSEPRPPSAKSPTADSESKLCVLRLP